MKWQELLKTAEVSTKHNQSKTFRCLERQKLSNSSSWVPIEFFQEGYLSHVLSETLKLKIQSTVVKKE